MNKTDFSGGGAKGKGSRIVPLFVAKDYIRREWSPIPVPFCSKSPTIPEWQKLRITEANVGEYFTHEPANIAVLMGPASKGLADVDLDCPEAERFAPIWLPKTEAVFGRASKPLSHYLYYVLNAEKLNTVVFNFPPSLVESGGKPTIIELRLGNKSGIHTIFPGSRHESGEDVVWAEDGKPASIGFSELNSIVSKIAVGAILLRLWPRYGRHETALRMGGLLARAGWDVDEAADFIGDIADQAFQDNGVQGDDNPNDRRRAVEDAFKHHEAGGNTYGLPGLKEHLGDDIGDRIAKYLRYQEVDTDTKLEEMNNKYCVVPWRGKTRVLTFEKEAGREYPVFFSFEDFTKLYSNQPVGQKNTLGKWWLSHPDRRQYGGLKFDPQAPRIIQPGNYLNQWRGWGIIPQPGDWSLLRKHIKTVLANGDAKSYGYIIKWTAWTLQNADQPAEVALVFRGGRGSGRGLIGRALRRAFGQHGLQVSTPDHLTGKFNFHLMDCVFLFADEAFWPGDKRGEATLKRIITEDTLAIEPKGLDVIQSQNRLHIFIAANADWVVPAAMDERRFACFDVSNRYQQDRQHFEPLYRHMDEEGGLAAMMNELLALPLKDWHPRRDIPQTQALYEQKLLSLSPGDEWWHHLLETGELPGPSDKPTTKDGAIVREANPRLCQTEALVTQARRKFPALQYKSDHWLTRRVLKKYGCDREQNWRINGQRAWQFPPLRSARKALDKLMRAKASEWDDTNEWEHPDDRI